MRITKVLKDSTFLVVSLVKVNQEVDGTSNVAQCTEEIRYCKQGYDLLCSGSHVPEYAVRHQDEQGAEAGKRTGGDGYIAGNRADVETDQASRTLKRSRARNASHLVGYAAQIASLAWVGHAR